MSTHRHHTALKTTQISQLALDPPSALTIILEMVRNKLEKLVIGPLEGRKPPMSTKTLADDTLQNL